jgi:PAS domain S-box-containing protein
VGDFVGQSLHLWIASVPDALVLVDARGLIIEVNAAMASLFGYQEEELLSEPIEVLVPERLRRAHVRKRVAHAIDPRDRPMGTNLEIRARRKDGSEFAADIQLCTREMPTGPVTVAVVRDLGAVHQLREVERRVKRIREWLGAQVEAPPERGPPTRELHEMNGEAERALEILRQFNAAGRRE